MYIKKDATCIPKISVIRSKEIGSEWRNEELQETRMFVIELWLGKGWTQLKINYLWTSHLRYHLQECAQPIISLFFCKFEILASIKLLTFLLPKIVNAS